MNDTNKDKKKDDAQFSEWLGLIIDDHAKADVLKTRIKETEETSL